MMWELHLIHWIKSDKNNRWWVYSHIHLPSPPDPLLYSYNSYRLNKHETLEQFCREHDESFPLQPSKFHYAIKGLPFCISTLKYSIFKNCSNFSTKADVFIKICDILSVEFHGTITPQQKPKAKFKKRHLFNLVSYLCLLQILLQT